jgi:hypothetical protein
MLNFLMIHFIFWIANRYQCYFKKIMNKEIFSITNIYTTVMCLNNTTCFTLAHLFNWVVSKHNECVFFLTLILIILAGECFN